MSGLLRHCRHVRKLDWPVRFARQAQLNGQRVIMVANGHGPLLAGRAVDVATDRSAADLAVSTGFCGGLDPSLRTGDIFVASRIETSEGESYPVAHVPTSERKHASGVLVSVDRVVQTVSEKQRLRAMGAAAVEMEAAGIASRAEARKLPYCCVRSVTDASNETLTLDFNTARASDGCLSRTRILAAALRRPFSLLPELIRLYRQSRAASRTLGDFLADCQF